MDFELHPNFSNQVFICDLPLCRVLMEDERHYPWLILVPRIPAIHKLIDLPFEDQIRLWKEIDTAQKIVWKQCKPTQLNVATIGNKTPQLHMHVIARFNHDPAWPGTIWDHPVRSKYDLESRNERVHLFRTEFENPYIL